MQALLEVQQVISAQWDIFFDIDPIDGKVYLIIYSFPYPEEGICEIGIREMPKDQAENYPKVIERYWSERPIVIFPPDSEEPIHFIDLWGEAYDCPLYEDMRAE